MVSNGLRMVARRGCDYPLRALFFGQAEKLVQRAPLFVSACSLAILQLQINRVASEFRECFRTIAWRYRNGFSNASERGLNFGERDHTSVDRGESNHST